MCRSQAYAPGAGGVNKEPASPPALPERKILKQPELVGLILKVFPSPCFSPWLYASGFSGSRSIRLARGTTENFDLPKFSIAIWKKTG
jgi:hypothetical protein